MDEKQKAFEKYLKAMEKAYGVMALRALKRKPGEQIYTAADMSYNSAIACETLVSLIRDSYENLMSE